MCRFVPIPTFESILTLAAQQGLSFVLDLKDAVPLGAYVRAGAVGSWGLPV